jgi:type VI secretion system secreted protein VgrG
MNFLDLGNRLPTLTVELRCDDVPAIGVLVTALELDEQIDGDYRARVVIASEETFAAKVMLGADCELVFVREFLPRRSLYGVIERVEDLGEVDHLQYIRLDIVPAFALLDYGQNSTIWQHKSVRDIVKALLEPALAAYGRKFEFGSTTRGARVRDYCVQYKESDYAFARRLLEEEGIAYDYVHEPGAGVEMLTLRDAMAQYVALDEAEIPVIEHDAAEADIESIQSFGHAHELTVTAVLRRDYSWKNPRDLLTQPNAGADERARQRRIYLHGRRRYVDDDLDQQAADALAAERAEGETLSGKGNVSSFVPGARFTLFHGGSEHDGEYVLTKVAHRYTNSAQDGGAYHNEFTCIPASVEYRPRHRTPKPRVYGPHTATVVGDDEIHTDEHGRIQVQFHWEESPSNAAGASCWIRSAQSWSGLGWGAQFIPRVGMEVIVEFLEGNPDRPFVTGCAFNGLNEFPFGVPGSKTQSGWRTRSSPDSEGYNMLRFEDAAGREEIAVHGQKDVSIVIENDKDQEIRHDESLHVIHDRNKNVDHDEREAIGNNRWITVAKNHEESIGASMVQSVAASKTVSIGGDSKTIVGGDKHVVVVGDAIDSVGKKYIAKVGEEIALVCGASSIIMTMAGKIAIRGTQIDIEASGDTTVIGAMVKLNP